MSDCYEPRLARSPRAVGSHRSCSLLGRSDRPAMLVLQGIATAEAVSQRAAHQQPKVVQLLAHAGIEQHA